MQMRALVGSVFLVFVSTVVSAQERPLCHDWMECRQFALKAYADHDYDAFHDFARRSLAAGPPRDPKQMFLLARAQSLSGRGDDAIQMLERLAQMGVATDAETSDDFVTARGASGWPALETTLKSMKPRLRLSSGASSSAARAAAAPVAPSAPPAPAPSAPSAPSAPVPETALRIPAT